MRLLHIAHTVIINFKKRIQHLHNMYPWSRNKNYIINVLSSMNNQSSFKSVKSTYP